jgi:predicted DNA binding CopG/RHH family protein
MSEETESRGKKKLPAFASEQEESNFWDTHDSTEYFEDTTPEDIVFVDARPRVTIKLEREALVRLKEVAQRKGVDYETLARMWVLERLKQETK